MKKQDKQINLSAQQTDKKGKEYLPGYPLYPAGEDIFSKSKEEGNINPEDISKTKELNEKC
jgi:hypothetical protein